MYIFVCWAPIIFMFILYIFIVYYLFIICNNKCAYVHLLLQIINNKQYESIGSLDQEMDS